MNSFRLLDGHIQFINALANVLDRISEYFSANGALTCTVYLGAGTAESSTQEHANVSYYDANALTLADALKMELVAKHYNVNIDFPSDESHAIVTVVAQSPLPAKPR